MKYITNLCKFIKNNQSGETFLFDVIAQYIFSLEDSKSQACALNKFLEQKWHTDTEMYQILGSANIPDQDEHTELVEEWVEDNLRLLYSKGDSKEAFYAELLDMLKSVNVEDRGYALTILYSNMLLPYRKIKRGVSMEEKEFGEAFTSIVASIHYGYQVIYSNFSQRTEVSSLLMKEADKLGEKDRIVFWATMLGTIEERAAWINKMESVQVEDNNEE